MGIDVAVGADGPDVPAVVDPPGTRGYAFDAREVSVVVAALVVVGDEDVCSGV